MLKYERYGFWFLVILCLGIVLLPQYYITGDGPSHTYNAKIWFDYLLNHDRSFYKSWYQLNRNVEPNYLSHFVLGSLCQFLSGPVADKVMQCIYILLFSVGFRFLIQSINTENSVLSYFFFPFLFSLTFQQGFYNYGLAQALMFFVLGLYARKGSEIFSGGYISFFFSFLLLLTTLSHGMIAGYTMVMILMIWLNEKIHQRNWRVGPELSMLILLILPSILLLGGFIFRTGLDTIPHHLSLSEKLNQFILFETFQCIRKAELYPAVISGVFMFLLILLQISRIKSSGAGWVFLLASSYLFYAYLRAPHSIGGAGGIDLRLSSLPLLFGLLYAASTDINNEIKKIILMLSPALLITFLVIRFPTIQQVDIIAKDIMTASDLISDKSVVLNLHLDDAQHVSSKEKLFECDSSFIHFSDYLGTFKKKIILLNNYEADIPYFPVQWRPGVSPLYKIPGMIPGQYPPCDDYKKYEIQSGRQIDYILLQNNSAYPRSFDCVQNLISQLDSSFDKVYESPKRYISVYKRKG